MFDKGYCYIGLLYTPLFFSIFCTFKNVFCFLFCFVFKLYVENQRNSVVVKIGFLQFLVSHGIDKI